MEKPRLIQTFLTDGKLEGVRVVELSENVPFRSPNHAGDFLTGHSTNAWLAFKDSKGRTMDEVMRKELGVASPF